MRKIIFDEKEQIEDILDSKIVKNISIKGLLILLVKYFYEEHKESKTKEYKKYIQQVVNT